jgi:hypothetical protein
MRQIASLLFFLFAFTVVRVPAQAILTKDSFFLRQKSLPDNYKSIITDSQWLYLGTYKSTTRKISVPDSVKVVDLRLFDNGRTYRKIRGKKIVSNSDFATQRIVYVDNSTLILESKDRKIVYRYLYRRRS